MSAFEILWLVFIISAFQRIVSRRTLDWMRQQRITQFERDRTSRVIVLIHRQGTDDDVPLDIILHTPGGLVLASVQIARAIRTRASASRRRPGKGRPRPLHNLRHPGNAAAA